jgi:hypothetical protein
MPPASQQKEARSSEIKRDRPLGFRYMMTCVKGSGDIEALGGQPGGRAATRETGLRRGQFDV